MTSCAVGVTSFLVIRWNTATKLKNIAMRCCDMDSAYGEGPSTCFSVIGMQAPAPARQIATQFQKLLEPSTCLI
jgi:hypothetical protein